MNGKKDVYDFDNVPKLILNCNNFVIEDGVMCKMVTLTLTGFSKGWCRPLQSTSIHTGDKFIKNFLHFF